MRTARIRELNDKFRASPHTHGRLVVTAGVNELGAAFLEKAICQVCTFDDFTEDNDPHDEHDFGSFVLEGEMLLWKIDYYDKRMQSGSEDPADATKTTRVLTIMLADEY